MSGERGMVIIGAGHAGGRAAHALREAGWTGAITLIGAEPATPYERPPLSKGLLTGEKSPPDFALYNDEAWAALDLRHIAGVAAAAIRRDTREVVMADGAIIPYERLLLAPGAAPRRLDLAGAELPGVCVLRDLTDAETLRTRLVPGHRLVVIGGGFIGLEVAASAIALGASVAVIEDGQRLMTRGVPPAISERMQARHVAAGVDLRLGAQVAAILGEDSVTGVRLRDGTVLPADTVLVAVGASPRIDLARDAGLAVDNGIVVDRNLRTEDPSIYAAGDACAFFHDLAGRHLRLESWKNAEDQGPLAARNMLGGAEAANAVPWMWSDQFELTIQVAGFPEQGTRIVERPLGDDAVVLFHLTDDGRLVAASGIGPNGAIGRVIRLGQMLIERGAHPDPAALADPAVNLKTLMRERAA